MGVFIVTVYVCVCVSTVRSLAYHCQLAATTLPAFCLLTTIAPTQFSRCLNNSPSTLNYRYIATTLCTLQLRTPAGNVSLPTFSAVRHAGAPPLSIHISHHTVFSSKPATGEWWDRQTERQMPWALYRPCCAVHTMQAISTALCSKKRPPFYFLNKSVKN